MDEVKTLVTETQKLHFKLDFIYVPSATAVAAKKLDALNNTRLHSRWIGGSEEEVEQNFAKFMNDLQAIKDAAPQLDYEVIEV